MVIIVFGVAGAGKTTVGRLLAAALGWTFYDADRFHSVANIDKMRRGVPLTDSDRAPWLESLRALIRKSIEGRENAILACSALTARYREYLKTGAEVRLVYLKANFPLIEERLRNRRGHFASPLLVQSQFDMLEPPEGEAIEIDAGENPAEIVKRVRSELQI